MHESDRRLEQMAQRTQCWLILWDMGVRTHSLILPIHQYPQSNLAFGVIEMLCDTALESVIGFLF